MYQYDEHNFLTSVYQDETYDFSTFLDVAGFEEDEVLGVIDELEAYRSIPGTTLKRYFKRVLNSVEEDRRTAFLKGIIVGTAIHENLENYDLERHITSEVDRRLREILDDLDPA
ncbi:hypothetical protein [Methanocrinis sp.]|uniref:hypothetical protein n=1 Tax=Methanocrinis sp. TaxID=3101522 RepID=UPI003D153387